MADLTLEQVRCYGAGIVRWVAEGEMTLEELLPDGRINTLLSYLLYMPVGDDFDSDFNGLSYDGVVDRTGQEFSHNKRKSKSHTDYTIYAIRSYEEAKAFRELCPEWCITVSEQAWRGYTEGMGSRFYFAVRADAADTFQVVRSSFPRDDYGLSVLAIQVDDHDRVIEITDRWNSSCDNWRPFFIKHLIGLPLGGNQKVWLDAHSVSPLKQ